MGDPDEEYKEEPAPKEPCDDAYYYRMHYGPSPYDGYPYPPCNTAEEMMERRAKMSELAFFDNMDDLNPHGPCNGMADEYDRYIRRLNNRFGNLHGEANDSSPRNGPSEAALERERYRQMFQRFERF